VQEAGGRVANLGKQDFDFRNTDLVASNAVIFDEVMAFMDGFMSEQGRQ
jgi:fructose-1,6-bisphosphatase/inositol monophosphatase family enzyme